MKKLIIAIISIIMATCIFTGCGDTVKPLENVGGEVLSGNGSFAVEKGDYVYFINGQEAVSVANEFGEVEKAALVRIKKSDLTNLKDATIETVVPKLLISESYKTGFYMYGDYVYYATPNNNKDKKGNVQYTQTEFFRLNLKTGKADKVIAVATSNSTEYRFIASGGKVYLAFVETESHTEDGSTETHTHSKLVIYNTETNKQVGEGFEYQEMLMPEDNSSTFYFTKNAYDEVNEEDKDYQEIYKYVIGAEKEELVVDGSADSLQVLQGANFTLIKNTGKYLFYKQTNLDTANATTSYNAIVVEDGSIVSLGGSNAYIDKAITQNMYVKSLEEIYYMDTTTELAGFNKFNYTVHDMTNGRYPVCGDVATYNLQFVEGEYAYFSNSEGIYYRCKLDGTEFNQINAVAMKTATDWYGPRVIGNYFIGSYSNELYYSYAYVVDMTNIGTDEYKDNLEDLAVESEENAISISETLIGKMTSSDKEAFEKALEEKFDED